MKDFGGDENFHVVSVDREGQQSKDLTPGEKVRAEIVDVLEDDDRFVLLSHNRRDAKVFDVYRVDVMTGEETMVAENPGNITKWITDHEGRLRAGEYGGWCKYSILYRETEQEHFRPF